MALVQSSDQRHPGTSQMAEGSKKDQGLERGPFVPKSKKWEKLVEKHKIYWCSARYFNAFQAANDDYLNYPPPSTVSDMESVSTNGTMSYLLAWRVVFHGHEGDVDLAKNLLWQHGASKKNAPSPAPKPKPSKDFTNEQLFNHALSHDTHLDIIMARKIANHLCAVNAISEDQAKSIKKGDAKLRVGRGKWNIVPKTIATLATVAAAAPIADAYDGFVRTYNPEMALLSSAALITIVSFRKYTNLMLLAIILFFALIYNVKADTDDDWPTSLNDGHWRAILETYEIEKPRMPKIGVLRVDEPIFENMLKEVYDDKDRKLAPHMILASLCACFTGWDKTALPKACLYEPATDVLRQRLDITYKPNIITNEDILGGTIDVVKSICSIYYSTCAVHDSTSQSYDLCP